MKKMNDFKVFTVIQAANLIGCCEETIRRACRSGSIKHVKILKPNRIFISDYSLKEWDDSRGVIVSEDMIEQVKNKMKEEK